jgi:hypothetical protein
MKKYRQLVKELPSSTIVLTVEDFNPPTAKHELQFKLIQKLVETHNADHAIYISESKDNLPVDRKIHFLETMFGNHNYKPLNEDVSALVARLENMYKKVIVISNNLKGNLSESVQVLSLEEDNVNFKSIVTKNHFSEFKRQLPTSFRDIDAKLLMNEMRKAYGLEVIKEEVKFSIDKLRDKYFKGEIYQIGDIVESAGQQYEIMDRGTNYLVVVNSTGDLSRKWVKDVNLVETCWKGYKQLGVKKKGAKTVPNCVPEEVQESTNAQVSYKGYTTQNFHHNAELAKAFKMSAVDAKDPVAMLHAIKTTDAYMDLHNATGENPSLDAIKTWKGAHIKAKESLQKLGVFDAHKEHWFQSDEALKKLLDVHHPHIKEGYSTAEVEKQALSYTKLMRAIRAAKHPTGDAGIQDTKKDPKVIVPNISTQVPDELDNPQTTTGSTLDSRTQLRRRKYQYG